MAAVLVAVLAGYLWAGSASLDKPAGRGLKEAAVFLADNPPKQRVVVMPFIMDEGVYHYAGKAIREALTVCLWQHRIDELAFVTHAFDRRFGLEEYWMLRTDGKRSGLRLSPLDFSPIFSAGSLVVHRFKGEGHQLFPAGAVQWQPDPGLPLPEVDVQAGSPAISDWPTIRVDNPSGASFGIRSAGDITVPTVGLAVLAYAHSDPDSRVTLLESADDGQTGEVLPKAMMRASSIPLQVVDEEGRHWFIRADTLPLTAGRTYGVYIEGGAEPTQLFAEIMCYFYPLSID
jgi:hypothetical protein